MKTLAKWEFETTIKGVLFGRNRTVEYNSSLLVEIYRKPLESLYEEINHLYWIVTSKGVLRKWGVHETTIDTYSAVFGQLEVALWDSREGSPTFGQTLIVELNADKGEALRIPPGVWHTFRAKSDKVVLLNSKSPGWTSDQTDKNSYNLSESDPPFEWPES